MNLPKPLILASRSPRRITLLNQVGIDAHVAPCDLPEDFDPSKSPAANATDLALQKARCVGKNIQNGIIIGADTIVVIDGQMLGKPADESDAARMLRVLSGHTHTVFTGFAILDRPSDRFVSDIEETLVTFRHLPDEEIAEYIAGGSPMDKAGAYGIQDDYGAVFVTRIEGCFYNVVGLPLSRLHRRLTEFARQI